MDTPAQHNQLQHPHPHPHLPQPAQPYPHALSGRSSPYLHLLPHQLNPPTHSQHLGTPAQTYAHAAGQQSSSGPLHIRTHHSANAGFALGAGMAGLSPITPTVSSERSRGDEWPGADQPTEPASVRDEVDGHEPDQPSSVVLEDEVAAAAALAGGEATTNAGGGANDLNLETSTVGTSVQPTPTWPGPSSGRVSRQSSVGLDAQQQTTAALNPPPQYYGQHHPSQLQYMYYAPSMPGAGGYASHPLASQSVYSGQHYGQTQQQQAYALEAASRQAQVAQQHHQQSQQAQHQQHQVVNVAGQNNSHGNSPNTPHGAALNAVANAAPVPSTGSAGGYYMPYPYGASHAQLGQQQPMYHYVPGYPAGYPQSIYRPPYSHAASSLGQGLNSLTSASEQLSAQDEAGPSNYHSGDGGDGRAASDAGGSEYSSILGAAEHEHEHEPEPKPVAAAPARSSGGGGGGGGRKGKRKAIVQPEPIDEEAYDEPLAPLPTKKEMAETKAAKKPRPKRKRPPGSQAGKEKKHKCATCGAAFARAYNLKTHEETHLSNPPKPYVCDHDSCSHKSFSRSHDLIRHRGSVHNEGPAAGKPPQKKTRPPKKRKTGGANGRHSVYHLQHDEDDEGLYDPEHELELAAQSLEGHELEMDPDQAGEDGLMDGGHEIGHHGEHGEEIVDEMANYDPGLIEPALYHEGDDQQQQQGQAHEQVDEDGSTTGTINPSDFTLGGAGGGGAKSSPARRTTTNGRPSATPSALLKRAHASGLSNSNGYHDDAGSGFGERATRRSRRAAAESAEGKFAEAEEDEEEEEEEGEGEGYEGQGVEGEA